MNSCHDAVFVYKGGVGTYPLEIYIACINSGSPNGSLNSMAKSLLLK